MCYNVGVNTRRGYTGKIWVLIMALIKCLECGKELSDKAYSCPNCGYPLDSTKDIKSEVCSTDKIEAQSFNSNIAKLIFKQYWWVFLIFVVCICMLVVSIYTVKQKQEAKYRVSFSDEMEMYELLSSGKWISNGLYFVFMMPGDIRSCTYKFVDAYSEFDTIYKNVSLDYSKGRIRINGTDSYYDIIKYNGYYYLRLNPKLNPATDLREKDYLFYKLIPTN